MSNNTKACCAEFYELPIVTALLGNELHPGGAALTRKLAGAALVARDTTVLDVACGRGESARLLASHFGCHVVGLDYSVDSITQAISLTEGARLYDRVRFLHGDAEQLPFDAETFDVVICECSLCTFPNLTAALEEMQRVLRPGGRLGLSDIVLNKAVPASLQDVLGRALCISGALSIEGYREALAAAGFAGVRCSDVSSVLGDMISNIERRAGAIENLMDGEQIELQEGLTLTRPKIAEAREFVKTCGVGYALIIGRKPRTGESTGTVTVHPTMQRTR